MKYFCMQRCFDNSKLHTYYENTGYDLGKDEVKHLKNIGLLKYFKEVPVEEKQPEESEDKSKKASPKKTTQKD